MSKNKNITSNNNDIYNIYLKYEQDNINLLERCLPSYKDNNKTIEEKLNKFFSELYTGEQLTLEEIYKEYTYKATNILKLPKKEQKTYEDFIRWLLEHGIAIERRYSSKHKSYKLYTIGLCIDDEIKIEEEQGVIIQ